MTDTPKKSAQWWTSLTAAELSRRGRREVRFRDCCVCCVTREEASDTLGRAVAPLEEVAGDRLELYVGVLELGPRWWTSLTPRDFKRGMPEEELLRASCYKCTPYFQARLELQDIVRSLSLVARDKFEDCVRVLESEERR